jgi:hypothetical protein
MMKRCALFRSAGVSTVSALILMVSLFVGAASAQQHFANVTSAAGIGGQNGLGHAVGWCDVDNDGDQDLAFSNQDGSDFWFYLNDGDGTFTNSTVIMGLGLASASKILWAELTGDDHADLLLTSGGCRLYRNDAGAYFTNITAGSGLSGYPKGVADIDGDGLADVITDSSDILRWHRNLGDGAFDTPQTIGSAPDAWTSVCFDYDLDGDSDLYIGTYGNSANHLFQNQGDGTFAEVGAAAGVNFAYASHGLTVGDYDNDGWPDLYVGGYSSQRCRMFRNNRDGTFDNVTVAAGLTAYPDTRTVSFVDYDNDGWLDIFASHHDFYSYSNVMWHNLGDGTFVNVAVDLGLSGEFIGDYFGLGWADFDADGAVDLFAAGHIDKYRLFRNLNCPGNYLHVNLVGSQSNRSALGAWATAHARGQSWTRFVTAGSGRQDYGSLTLKFGLATNTDVDSLVIHWPSGRVQRVGPLPANQTLEIVEDGGASPVTDDLIGLGPGLELSSAPNPFNPVTSLRFRLPEQAGSVRLAIYDTSGRHIRRLDVDRISQWQTVVWNGRTDGGSATPSGQYFARLDVDGVHEVIKLSLVR